MSPRSSPRTRAIPDSTCPCTKGPNLGDEPLVRWDCTIAAILRMSSESDLCKMGKRTDQEDTCPLEVFPNQRFATWVQCEVRAPAR